MLKGKIFLTVMASLALVLVAVNILLSLGNQSIQMEVGSRQQFIAQSIQLESLSRELVMTLANIAVKTKDEQLKNLLASSGVGFSEGPGPAAGSK